MAGLSACTALVELYLSHNGIWALDSGLTRLTALKVCSRGSGVDNARITAGVITAMPIARDHSLCSSHGMNGPAASFFRLCLSP